MISPYFFFFLTLILSIGASTDCYGAVDVVQVQSLTPSFVPSFSKMTEQLGSILQALRATGSDSRFGFATSGDKPISGKDQRTGDRHVLGGENAYCVSVDAPLRVPSESQLLRAFRNAEKRSMSSIGDWPDAVIEGVYRTVIAPGMAWRNETAKKQNVGKLLFVVTDTMSHLMGDVLVETGNDVYPYDISADDMMRHKADNYDCDKVEYVNPNYLRRQIFEKEIGVVFLVAPGGTYDSKGKFTPNPILAQKGSRYRGEDGLLLWYQDLLRDARVDAVAVLPLDREMKNYGLAVKMFIERSKGNLCKLRRRAQH